MDKEKFLKTFDKVMFVFTILYYTGTLNFFGGATAADNPTLTNATAEAGNSAILSFFQLIVYVGTIVMTSVHYKKVIYLITKRKFLWGLVAIIMLSFLWSDVPDIAIRRGIVFFGTILFALNIAARFTVREQLFLLAWTMGFTIVINLVFTLALPWAGIESGEHQGAWRGVYSQKNVFSRNMVLSSITFVLAILASKTHRRLLLFGLGFSVLLILLSTSKGALVVFIALLALVQLFRSLRWNNSLLMPFLILGVLITSTAILLFIGNTETIVKLLGRDLTLTGRTGIWSVVIGKIAQHPWLGYGYRSFWLGMQGDSADVWYETFFMAPNSHNGFLDVAVETGLVGLSCFLLTFTKSCLRAIQWVRLNPTAEGLFPIMYLMFVLLNNLIESTILDPAIFVLILYTSITTAMLVQPIPVQDSLQSLKVHTLKA
jgi:O-antigen ligase